MRSYYGNKINKHLVRAEKISAIEKEVTKGTYKVDSATLANIMIKNLLNHTLEFHSSPKFH